MKFEELKNKKIAVVGLGTNNQRLVDFFKNQGINFELIVDWKDKDELIGKLDRFDVLFRTPGLPYLSKAVQSAKMAGVEILSQTKLFFELCKASIIAVTGTKGKGTTASLISKILSDAGKKVWLGGNIGTDPFQFIDMIKPDDLVVLELSSFQLQDLEASPHIAVVLSVTADHLNHHQDFDEYIRAKSSIISFQSEKDYAVLHPSLPYWFKDLGKGKKIYINPQTAKASKPKLLGAHNLDNIAASMNVAKILGIEDAKVLKSIEEFEPLPHRLNFLKTVNGVNFVDDGFSTNIEPTIAAINAFESNIVLIVGGSDKGLDFSKLGETIVHSRRIKTVIVIGDVTNQILKSLAGFEGQILTGATTMEDIIKQALASAVSGDTVLFSPGTASFGLFKNEFDRSEQFVDTVNKL